MEINHTENIVINTMKAAIEKAKWNLKYHSEQATKYQLELEQLEMGLESLKFNVKADNLEFINNKQHK